MAPLQESETASRPSTRSPTRQEEGYTRQEGLSSSRLASDAATAAHEESGPMTSPEVSRSTSPSHPINHTSKLGSVAVKTQVISPLLPPHRRPSYAPAVPSPLNPASPTASLKSRDSYTGSSEETRRNGLASSTLSRSKSSNAAGIASPLGRPSIPPPRRAGMKPLEMGDLRKQRSPPALRPQTPLALSDLGRDYSRYPFHDHSILHSASSSPPPHHGWGTVAAGNEAARTPIRESSANRDPFSDSSTRLANNEGSEKIFSPFLDDRIGGPSTAECGYSFPMYLDEKEPDDDMHMPYPDDDKNLKPKFKEYFARGQICSLIGMAFMIIGLLALFVILPVLSYTGVTIYGYSSERGSGSDPEAWAFVNTVKYPLMSNIRTGLIDPTTPQSAMTRRGIDGEDLQLVFSDEFNGQNRTFYPGDDPFWTAPDLWYGATQDLEFFDPD
ncbi:MAG: hypothetical protein M1830_004537, partial [Pleopsidium flavum]